MAQITWRNIDAPDLTRALAGIATANTGMQEALGGARTALQDFQTDRERNVSKELLAGVLGASDEAGLDSFMQGQRAQQLLTSGLVNPEALATVSQQRSNLLSQAINRTGLEQAQNDMATQGALAEAAYALGMGEQVDPSLLANALNNSRASQVLPGLASGNRLFDYNVMNSDRNFALQQQKLAETMRYNNARLSQQAKANSAGASPYGRINSSGNVNISPELDAAVFQTISNSENDAAAWSNITSLLDNVPDIYHPAIMAAAEKHISRAGKVRDAAGKPEKSNYFVSDFKDPGAVTKLANSMGVDLGKEESQALYHTLNNLGKNQSDVVIPANDLFRIFNSASSLGKSGELNMNPGAFRRGTDFISGIFNTSPTGPGAAPMSLFNQLLGSATGTGNTPEDLYVHGGDKYQNDAVRKMSEALINLPNLNLTVNGKPLIPNQNTFIPPYYLMGQ